MSEVIDQARAALGARCEGVAWMPGRIEVVGKHTDYAMGTSMVCAIDKGLALAFTKREDRVVCVKSMDMEPAEICFELDNWDASTTSEINRSGWAVYVGAVIRFLGLKGELQERKGMDIVIKSSLPPNAGLSSSSALVCGIAAIMTQGTSLELSVDDLGKIESMDLVGTRGGSQDHAAIMLSKAGCLSVFSYVNGTKLEKYVPFDENLRFIIAVSGITACKTGNALEKYNALAGASYDEKIEKAKAESNLVVPMTCSALEDGDFTKLGDAIALSQQHAETVLFTSVPETEWLPKHAVELGAIGSSTFGAGFGGSVYAVIQKDRANAFMERWHAAYCVKFPDHQSTCEFFLTSPSGGAKIILEHSSTE